MKYFVANTLEKNRQKFCFKIGKKLHTKQNCYFFDGFDDHLHINLFNLQRKKFDYFSREYTILKKQLSSQNLFEKKV